MKFVQLKKIVINQINKQAYVNYVMKDFIQIKKIESANQIKKTMNINIARYMMKSA